MVKIPFVTSLKLREKWKSLKPPRSVKWDDIKISGTYHIPPIDGERRRIIKVLAIGKYWIKYKKENDKFAIFDTDYLYSSDIAACFMFEINNN